MCAAAHANVGLGRIVYASSTAQLVKWRLDLGIEAGLVAALPINDVAPGIPVEGPAPGLDEEVRELHQIKKTKEEEHR
jgi:tRNA(Arg) A34 adenosine deaminase TadA